MENEFELQSALPEVENPLFEEMAQPLVDRDVADKKAELSAIAQLPDMEESTSLTADYARLIDKNKASYILEDDLKAVDNEIRARQKQREVEIASGTNVSPQFGLDYLTTRLSEIENDPYPLEREAAEVLSDVNQIPVDPDGEVEEDPWADSNLVGGIAIQTEMLRRRLVTSSLSLEEGKRRGLAPADERGLLNAFDILLTAIPGYSTFPLTGLVPGENVNILDKFFGGGQVNRESSIVYDPLMSPEEFDRLIPQIVSNTYDNTTYRVPIPMAPANSFEYSNKFQQEQLIHQLYDPASAFEINSFAALDYSGVLGAMKTVGKGGFGLLTKLRAAKAPSQAAETAATILVKAEAEGLETAAKAVGSNTDEVADTTLAGVVNPNSVVDTGTSLAGETLNRLERGRIITKEMGTVDDAARLRNTPEELAAAEQAAVERATKIIEKQRIADVKSRNLTPNTGINTPGVDIFIGTKAGKGFSKPGPALRLMEEMGIKGDVIYIDAAPGKVVTKPTPKFKPAPPQRDVDIKTAKKRINDDKLNGVFVGDETVKPLARIAKVVDLATSTKSNMSVVVTSNGNIIAAPADLVSPLQLAKNVGLSGGDIGFATVKPGSKIKSFEDLYKTTKTPMGKEFQPIGMRKKAPNKDGVSADVVRDYENGTYFIQFTMPVNEKGFFSNINITPSFIQDSNVTAKLTLGGRQLQDDAIQGMAVAAEGRRNQMMHNIKKYILPKYNKLNKLDWKILNDVVARSRDEERWLTAAEVTEAFYKEASTGNPENLIKAYYGTIDLNDMEFFLRNAELYSKKSTVGMMTVSAKTRGQGLPRMNGTVQTDLTQRPKGLIYDGEAGQRLSMEDWSKLDKKKLKEEGYIILDLETPWEIDAQGYRAGSILIKRQNATLETLEYNQLGYRPGLHRIYDNAVRHWVKGARIFSQPDGSARWMENPMTLVGEVSKEAATDYARRFNALLDEAERFMNKELTPKGFLRKVKDVADDLHIDADEFYSMIDSRKYDPKNKVEVVGDRELPSQYKDNPDAADFVGDVDAVFDHQSTVGRLYYSKRGDHMLDTTGNPLPVQDVHDVVNKSLMNVANLVGFGAYKVRQMETWVGTFGDLLAVEPRASLAQRFKAPFRENLTEGERKMANIAEQQRSTALRTLNWTSTAQHKLDTLGHRLANLMEEAPGFADASKDLQASLIKGAMDTGNLNPIRMLKGLVFQMKLGWWNIGQFPLQISTISGVVSIAPVKGAQAVASLPAMRAYGLFKGSPKGKADFMKWTGGDAGAKVAGFDSAEEMWMMLEKLETSGFIKLNNTYAVMDDFNPMAGFNLTGNKLKDVADHRTFFFFEAEKWNRSAAWNVAWREIKERAPGLKVGEQEFLEAVIKRADDLSVNMTNASSAAWQKNAVAGLPLQFFSYPIRQVELMLGKQLTVPEKLRYALGQFLFYGTAGIPLVTALTDNKNDAEGAVPTYETDVVGTVIERGLIDTLLYMVSDGELDVTYSSRAGTGAFFSDLVRELFNVGRYGDVSAAELAGGATVSVLLQSGTDLNTLRKYVAIESGNYPISEEQKWNLVQEQAVKFAQNWSTLNNGLKAYAAFQYNTMYSKAGTPLAKDVTTPEAFALALGIPLAEMRDANAKMAWMKSRKDSVAELSSEVIKRRQRLDLGHYENPEQRQQLEDELMTLIALTPPELVGDVLRDLGRYPTEPWVDSITKSYLEKKEKDKLMLQLSGKDQKENN